MCGRATATHQPHSRSALSTGLTRLPRRGAGAGGPGRKVLEYGPGGAFGELALMHADKRQARAPRRAKGGAGARLVSPAMLWLE